MITEEEFELLCREDVRHSVEENMGRDPLSVALDKRLPHAAVVATQVKYLQKSRRKLPSYFEHRCIVPSRAFEQSSGEACAAARNIWGGSVLDLTCGLGVDAAALSKMFARVVTVERDEVLAKVARENFRRMGIDNIEVVCDTAENYVSRTSERFDWCFADPDRRGSDGGKRVLAEDCSPDMLKLIPEILRRGTAERISIKLSPMFDTEEAFRIFGGFGPCSVDAVSREGECKEVAVYIDPDRRPSAGAVVAGRGSFRIWRESMAAVSDMKRTRNPRPIDRYRYMIVPDVALQKARLVSCCFGGEADVVSENGFVFSVERPSDDVLGRVFEIDSAVRYEPRRLRAELKGCRAEIMLRDVPLSAAGILRATGMREGGDIRMAFTSWGGEIWAVRLK